MNKFPKLRYKGFNGFVNKEKIGTVATVLNGFPFSSSKYVENGKYNILTISNVTGETFVDIQKCNTIEEVPNEVQEHQYLKNNDILISLTGNVGRVSKNYGNNNLLNQRVGKLVPKESLCNEYLFHCVSSKKFEKKMVAISQGAAQLNIGKGDIINFSLGVPNKMEQVKISSLLYKLDELIKEKEKEIEALKATEITIMDLVRENLTTSNYVPLRDITLTIGDGLHGTPKYSCDGIVPFINGNSINKGKINILDNTKFISNDEFSKYKCVDTKGCVAISLNGTIGNVALFDDRIYMLGKSIGYIAPNSDYSSKYIYYELLNKKTQAIIKTEVTGSTIKNLSLNTIRNLKIKECSVSNQIKYTNILESLNNCINVQEEILSKQINVKKYLSNKMLL